MSTCIMKKLLIYTLFCTFNLFGIQSNSLAIDHDTPTNKTAIVYDSEQNVVGNAYLTLDTTWIYSSALIASWFAIGYLYRYTRKLKAEYEGLMQENSKKLEQHAREIKNLANTINGFDIEKDIRPIRGQINHLDQTIHTIATYVNYPGTTTPDAYHVPTWPGVSPYQDFLGRTDT
jgi:hypothetical protein